MHNTIITVEKKITTPLHDHVKYGYANISLTIISFQSLWVSKHKTLKLHLAGILHKSMHAAVVSFFENFYFEKYNEDQILIFNLTSEGGIYIFIKVEQLQI